MIRTANVVEDVSGEDEVGLDNTVQVYFPDDDITETCKLVTAVRGDSLSNLITIASPLGKALLKHKTGDTVTVKVNENYSYEVIVKSIEKTSDEGKEKIRRF